MKPTVARQRWKVEEERDKQQVVYEARACDFQTSTGLLAERRISSLTRCRPRRRLSRPPAQFRVPTRERHFHPDRLPDQRVSSAMRSTACRSCGEIREALGTHARARRENPRRGAGSRDSSRVSFELRRRQPDAIRLRILQEPRKTTRAGPL